MFSRSWVVGLYGARIGARIATRTMTRTTNAPRMAGLLRLKRRQKSLVGVWRWAMITPRSSPASKTPVSEGPKSGPTSSGCSADDIPASWLADADARVEGGVGDVD